MPPNHRADVTAALARLASQVESYRSRQPKGRGRPSQGIRCEYIRTEVYLEPAVRAALDRLAAVRQRRTGKSTSRADVIREALTDYVREHVPETGV